MKSICYLLCYLFIFPAFSQELNQGGIPRFPKNGWSLYELKGKIKSMELKVYANLGGSFGDRIPVDSLRDHYIVVFDSLGFQEFKNYQMASPGKNGYVDR